MSSFFRIEKHIIDASHIREYPHATRNTNDAVKLAVKRYTPKSNSHPQPGDVTIIGAHGSAFPKELYEPIWEQLYIDLKARGVRIRSIWIADTANQAASGILNEEVLGNDPSWFDHARDLLFMINQFKREMPTPIVGVGHSLGAGQLGLLSFFHPSLLTSLVFIDPVFEKDIHTGLGPAFASLSMGRKDRWSSQIEAKTYFKKQYKRWDDRVLERWLKYGLRDVLTDPAIGTTETIEQEQTKEVTLSTPPTQEIIQYIRPNVDHHTPNTPSNSTRNHDSTFLPDIIGPPTAISPFYRYEPILLWHLMPHIRPSVLYLFGEKSPVSLPHLREEKASLTGTGISGSGGLKRGRVRSVTVPGAGHHLAFEDVGRVAGESALWLCAELQRWKGEEERVRSGWVDITAEERRDLPRGWKGALAKVVKGRGAKL